MLPETDWHERRSRSQNALAARWQIQDNGKTMRSAIKSMTGAAAVAVALTMLTLRRLMLRRRALVCGNQSRHGRRLLDCRYRTVEECVPNVIAGNRGFCNLNPRGPGPASPAQPPQAAFQTSRFEPLRRRAIAHLNGFSGYSEHA
jgi:hypothetical protein